MKLLVTRFKPGSAGKLLSTVLQCSKEVDHWCPVIQDNKKSEYFHQLTNQYIDRSFPIDHAKHVMSEPMVHYNTEFYSSTYDRGRHTNSDEFIYLTRNDPNVNAAIEANLHLNLIYHKTELPDFCMHNKCVTILSKSEVECDWIWRSLISKNYEINGDSITHIAEDPTRCSFKSLPLVLRFNNQFKFNGHEKNKILKKLKDSIFSSFRSEYEFEKVDMSNKIQTYFIEIKSFFETDLFLNEIIKIHNIFDLGAVDEQLVRSIHKRWWAAQIK